MIIKNSGNPDNIVTDAVSVHAGDDFGGLLSEDNKEDEPDDVEANAAVKEQLRRLNKCSPKVEKTSDSIRPKLAAAIGLNKIWVNQADEDKTKGRLNKYLMPKNCTGLSVVKVSPEIWLTCKSRIRPQM